ncbi:uncharacterized protein METZ01_LOCUS393357, partial [marine metagenome]
ISPGRTSPRQELTATQPGRTDSIRRPPECSSRT